MTHYLQSRFTVPTGQRETSHCQHGWSDFRGKCVFCGADVTELPQSYIREGPGLAPSVLSSHIQNGPEA